MTYVSKFFAAVVAVTTTSVGAFAQTAQPTAADTTRIVEASSAYFQARDAGNYAAAYAMLDAELSAALPFSDAQSLWTSQTAQGITFETAELVDVTWYVDPDGLPAGAYAAVDFRNSPRRKRRSFAGSWCGVTCPTRRS